MIKNNFNTVIQPTSGSMQPNKTEATLYINHSFIARNNTLLTSRSLIIKKTVIPAEEKNSIITAIASNDKIKINKIINDYHLDSLARLKFDFEIKNNITYKNINLFFLACCSGCIKIAQKLINNTNININEQVYTEGGISGRTALIIASSRHIEIVKLLLENNANIEIKDECGHDVIHYSLAMGGGNIDRCYEIQKLLHNSKQKLGLVANYSDLTVNIKSCFHASMNFFNDNQDFIIIFFHTDNNNIYDFECRTNNSFIQKFLDTFKSYIIQDTQKPVFFKIIAILNEFSEDNETLIDFKGLEANSLINESLKVTVYKEQKEQNVGSYSIKFHDKMTIIDYMIPIVAIIYNKELSKIKKSDLIILLVDTTLKIIKKSSDHLNFLFSEDRSKVPDKLFDISKLSEEQELEAINELIRIAVILSVPAIKKIPEHIISSWK